MVVPSSAEDGDIQAKLTNAVFDNNCPRRGCGESRRMNYSSSCAAADVAKPKARLCEPWVNVTKLIEAARRRGRLLRDVPLDIEWSPLRGSTNFGC